MNSKLALRFLFSRKMRSILAIVLIAVMLSGSILLTSLNSSIEEATGKTYSKKYLETMVVLPDRGESFNKSDFREISQNEDVEGYIAFSPFLADVGGKTRGASVFYLSNPSLMNSWLGIEYTGEYEEGKVLKKKEVQLPSELYLQEKNYSRTGLKLGSKKDKMLGCIFVSGKGDFYFEPMTNVFDIMRSIQKTNPITVTQKEGEKFTVGGTFDASETTIPYLKELDMMFLKKPEKTNLVIIKTDIDKVSSVGEQLEEDFPDSTVFSFKEQYEDLVNKINSISQLFFLTSLVLLIITILVIGITISKVIVNRKKEIGLLRTVGASEGQITKLFLLQSLVFSAVSVAASLTLALILSSLVDNFLSKTFALPSVAVVNWPTALWMSLVVVITSILTALIATWRIRKLKTSDLIRS